MAQAQQPQIDINQYQDSAGSPESMQVQQVQPPPTEEEIQIQNEEQTLGLLPENLS
jgi:hypothetical protein